MRLERIQIVQTSAKAVRTTEYWHCASRSALFGEWRHLAFTYWTNSLFPAAMHLERKFLNAQLKNITSLAEIRLIQYIEKSCNRRSNVDLDLTAIRHDGCILFVDWVQVISRAHESFYQNTEAKQNLPKCGYSPNLVVITAESVYSEISAKTEIIMNIV